MEPKEWSLVLCSQLILGKGKVLQQHNQALVSKWFFFFFMKIKGALTFYSKSQTEVTNIYKLKTK